MNKKTTTDLRSATFESGFCFYSLKLTLENFSLGEKKKITVFESSLFFLKVLENSGKLFLLRHEIKEEKGKKKFTHNRGIRVVRLKKVKKRRNVTKNVENNLHSQLQ